MKRLLLVVAVVAALSQAAFALDLVIEPEMPRSDDVVQITAGEEFPDSRYVLQYFNWSVTGNEIQIDIHFSQHGDVWLQVLTWCGDTAEVGPLEPGDYKVNVDAWMIRSVLDLDDASIDRYHYGSISATFQVLPATLTPRVASTPINGVRIAGEPNAAGGITDYLVRLHLNTRVSLTAQETFWKDGVSYGFVGWRSSNTTDLARHNTITFPITHDTSLTAIYREELELRLNTDPWGHAFGAFRLDPEPIRYIPLEDGRLHAMYAKGTVVTVYPKEQLGDLRFDHWTNDDNLRLDVTESNALKVLMDQRRAYTAHYVHTKIVELLLDTDPRGLALRAFTLEPEPLEYIPTNLGSIRAVYAVGTLVTVHAAERVEGLWFDVWMRSDGNAADADGRNTLTVLMDRAKSFMARYVERDTVVLSIDSVPWGLAPDVCTLDPEPLTIVPTDDGNLHAVYPRGTQVTVLAGKLTSRQASVPPSD